MLTTRKLSSNKFNCCSDVVHNIYKLFYTISYLYIHTYYKYYFNYKIKISVFNIVEIIIHFI